MRFLSLMLVVVLSMGFCLGAQATAENQTSGEFYSSILSLVDASHEAWYSRGALFTALSMI